ncbi:hypothetical protein LX77_03238 [Gelidibacter algens]|uniref:Uncharacterized protein n=1 Tax=Gelidibacter algens TaxID=49280 RepID=A0A1A7QZZ8_9FLAO|nr:hypothetical protein [Gelidibacter algens]OBX25136.1 hypothetical protein A9996_11565 [Gelidibacter algens]RAJ20024.1 hypothetical protein LX77_03238 [Gelidibacter algens]
MIENLPNWINWLFLLTAMFTIGMFHVSNGKPVKLTFLIILWGLGQSILALTGYYQKTDIVPPRFLWVLIPVVCFIIFGMFKKQRTLMIESRQMNISTFLHVVRIPVEIVLFYLFVHKMVPGLMTFEGRNFEILAGISAPIVGVLTLKSLISRKMLIIWNVISLFLVLFIMVNGILSSDLPIQMFGFEQPNRAINYFPFILLPATIVPIVIYTHLIDIIKLWNVNDSKNEQNQCSR